MAARRAATAAATCRGLLGGPRGGGVGVIRHNFSPSPAPPLGLVVACPKQPSPLALSEASKLRHKHSSIARIVQCQICTCTCVICVHAGARTLAATPPFSISHRSLKFQEPWRWIQDNCEEVLKKCWKLNKNAGKMTLGVYTFLLQGKKITSSRSPPSFYNLGAHF